MRDNPRKLIIADEAYMGFYGESLAPLVKKYENLLVVKTFSKYYALAGIRCGYAIGGERTDRGAGLPPRTVSIPIRWTRSVAVCAAASSDGEYYRQTAKR